ncbi:MAG: hypothetical protein IJL06_08325 [Kiritimatiellae bacterium]|nr:hypothetical protein [Kiritimatiellia bacterium]
MRAQTAETLRRLKSALPGLAAAALFAGAALLLSGPRTVWGNPTGEVPLELPDELGPWRAERVYYCTSNQCARSWLESQLAASPTSQVAGPEDIRHSVFGIQHSCPECGAPLAGISLGETTLLPDATPIFRRVYRRAGHPDIMATVVFSGIERRSIHRPQVCLVAQGNRILDEYTRPTRASLADPDATAPLRVLELAHADRDPATGRAVSQSLGVYAYWLFNPERETVHHLARFARMMFDNCFRAYRPRWGYASISLARDPSRPGEWEEELDDFLPRFRPLIDGVRARLDADRSVPTVLEGFSAGANVYAGTNAPTSGPSRR